MLVGLRDRISWKSCFGEDIERLILGAQKLVLQIYRGRTPERLRASTSDVETPVRHDSYIKQVNNPWKACYYSTYSTAKDYATPSEDHQQPPCSVYGIVYPFTYHEKGNTSWEPPPIITAHNSTKSKSNISNHIIKEKQPPYRTPPWCVRHRTVGVPRAFLSS